MESLFKFENFDEFDKHINASIPTLDQLDVLVKRVIYDMAQEDTCVVDLGCSTGRVLRSAPKRDGAIYIGIDKDMDNEDSDGVVFWQQDITHEALPKSSVIISMFTLQFLPPHKRQNMLKKIHDALVCGGVFIFAEKTHANNPRIDTLNQTALMVHKTANFTSDDIVQKQIGISPIMHLRTEAELFKELAIFDDVSTIWAWGGFRAVVATKEF